MIEGGYILQPRKFCESSVSGMPPVTREVWLYLLRKVNYYDNSRTNIKRGSGFFTYSDIINDLCWYAGYRKITYKKNDIAKSLRRLRESTAIATTKETRGIIVTICNFELYQDPKNYESTNESTTKAPRKHQSENSIHKEEYNKNKKNKKNKTLSVPLKGGSFFVPSCQDIEGWVSAYPDVDVEGELKKLISWNTSNARKRKTASGIKKHINFWLSGKNKKATGDMFGKCNF